VIRRNLWIPDLCNLRNLWMNSFDGSLISRIHRLRRLHRLKMLRP